MQGSVNYSSYQSDDGASSSNIHSRADDPTDASQVRAQQNLRKKRSGSYDGMYQDSFRYDSSESEFDDEEDEAEDSRPAGQSQKPATALWEGKNLKKEDELAEQDIISSYYDLDDVRLPPRPLDGALLHFYLFFLLIGIPISPIHRPSRRQKRQIETVNTSSRNAKAEEACLREYGAAPVPVLAGFGQNPGRFSCGTAFWRSAAKIKWLFIGISLIALAIHTAFNLMCALHSPVVVMRMIFIMFRVFAVGLSVLLASEILSRRQIGTRIFYVLSNTQQRQRNTRLIRGLLKLQVTVAVLCAIIGFTADVFQLEDVKDSLDWFVRYFPDLPNVEANPKHAAIVTRPTSLQMREPLSVLWLLSSLIVRLQLTSGAAVFCSLVGTHLLRIESCIRALRRPGTSVRMAMVQIFDIDVSLAEVGYILDVRLSCLLVFSFLSFFFESLFLNNRQKDDDPTNNVSAADILSLACPAMLCGWLLVGFSGINQACQRLRIVAYRFAGFQERERLNAKDKIAELGQGGEGRKKHKKHKSGSNSDEEAPSGSGRKKSDPIVTEAAVAVNKHDSADEAKSSSMETTKKVAAAAAAPEVIGTDPAPPPPSDAAASFEKSLRDLDGDGDVDMDDDLALLKERLNALLSYLKNADLSLRLANIEIGPQIMWGFLLVVVSAIFNLLQIRHGSMLP